MTFQTCWFLIKADCYSQMPDTDSPESSIAWEAENNTMFDGWHPEVGVPIIASRAGTLKSLVHLYCINAFLPMIAMFSLLVSNKVVSPIFLNFVFVT